MRVGWGALAVLMATCASVAQDGAERFLLYRVERIDASSAPIIDGNLDEAVWQSRLALTSMRNFLGPLTGDLATQESEFVILSDGPMLYIGATFHDQQMDALAANPATAPYWNDCTELYFDPHHDGGMSIQLTIDCLGQRFWARQIDEGAGWWNDSAWYTLAQWQVAVSRGKTAWTIELSIAAETFDIDTSRGSVCGFNACRFRLGSENQEFSAWGFGGSRRQKNMDAWGHLLFLPKGERAGGAITAQDVAAVYGDLGKRRIRVPVDGAFIEFAAGDEQRLGFGELLGDAAGEVRRELAAARAAVEQVPAEDRRGDALRAKLPELEKRADDVLAAAKGDTLTLGAHDRLTDELGELHDELHQLTWQAKLILLAVDAKGADE